MMEQDLVAEEENEQQSHLCSASTSDHNEEKVQDTWSNQEFLTQYITQLKNENSNWKLLLAERRRQYKEEKKNSRKSIVLSYEVCADALTEEDKSFLTDHPNYQKIASDFDKLLQTAAMCIHMKQKPTKTVNHMLSIAKQHEMAAKEYIFSQE